jgi:hypothetical protein
VKNFTGGGAVKSFQIPYHCRECDEEKSMLVETSDMTSPSATPPVCICESCGRSMDIDEMPESYFAFLGTVPRPEEVARGSSASVVKSRVRTRERRSEPPARRSYPSLSAYQTPTPGVSTRSSDKLLAKRPSQPKIAIGSSERISGQKISTQLIGTTKISTSKLDAPPMAQPKSNGVLIGALVVLLLGAIGALGYLVLTL